MCDFWSFLIIEPQKYLPTLPPTPSTMDPVLVPIPSRFFQKELSGSTPTPGLHPQNWAGAHRGSTMTMPSSFAARLPRQVLEHQAQASPTTDGDASGRREASHFSSPCGSLCLFKVPPPRPGSRGWAMGGAVGAVGTGGMAGIPSSSPSNLADVLWQRARELAPCHPRSPSPKNERSTSDRGTGKPPPLGEGGRLGAEPQTLPSSRDAPPALREIKAHELLLCSAPSPPPGRPGEPVGPKLAADHCQAKGDGSVLLYTHILETLGGHKSIFFKKRKENAQNIQNTVNLSWANRAAITRISCLLSTPPSAACLCPLASGDTCRCSTAPSFQSPQQDSTRALWPVSP